MKTTCQQQCLEKAVSTVQRAVSTKSTIPALEGILIKARGEKLYLCGYNLEIGITTTIDADILQEGEIIINAKIFSEIIRKLPGEEITIQTDDSLAVKITSDKSKFSIIGMSTEGYPKLPQITQSQKISLPSSVFRSMIKQTVFAVAETNTNPTHTGSLFEIEEGKINIVSVDGYRLAIRTEPINTQEESKFIVPGKTLNEISKLLPETDEDINFSVGQGHIVLKLNENILISRLIDGIFLNYKANIPQSCTTEATVDTSEFISSIERVSLLITDRAKSPLKISFTKDSAKISCTTTLGKADDEIEIQTTGEDLEIGFNNRFLLDALRNTDCDQVKIQMNGHIGPMKISPKEGDSFTFLVLPVRLRPDES